MAQVNVNFRMDEDVKKRMEQACKEMGLSMTTAFTMFATKVGNEKRIPFEIAAKSTAAKTVSMTAEPAVSGAETVLRARREQAEELLARVRRALTNISTAIPVTAYGMTVEQIRLLCADELKDKIAASLASLRSVLSDRGLAAAKERDGQLLEQYRDELSDILAETESIERMLIPVLRAWNGEDRGELDDFAGRLAVLSGRFGEVQVLLQKFTLSTAKPDGSAAAVQERIRRCSAQVSDPDVIAELRILEALVCRRYDGMDEGTKSRLDGFYLSTVERTAEELGKAERNGEETEGTAQLCLRAIQVVSQTIAAASQIQRDVQHSDLEAEVIALERLAAMRGDVSADKFY